MINKHSITGILLFYSYTYQHAISIYTSFASHEVYSMFVLIFVIM